jgi:hypothetical protein
MGINQQNEFFLRMGGSSFWNSDWGLLRRFLFAAHAAGCLLGTESQSLPNPNHPLYFSKITG